MGEERDQKSQVTMLVGLVELQQDTLVGLADQLDRSLVLQRSLLNSYAKLLAELRGDGE